VRTDGRTGITSLTVALNSYFANAPQYRRTMVYVSITYFIFHQTFQTAKLHSPYI